MPSDTILPKRPKKPISTGKFIRLSWKRMTQSWGASVLIHVLVILLLGLVTLPLPVLPELSLQAVHILEEELDTEELLTDVVLEVETEELAETVDVIETEMELLDDSFQAEELATFEVMEETVDFSADFGDVLATGDMEEMAVSGLQGRSGAIKANLLRSGGGTKSSEKAVQSSLNWIARHQRPDGSWNFVHTEGECAGRCNNPGSAAWSSQARAAATGLALLTYLGAGHTPLDGEYRQVVGGGINALVGMANSDENGVSFKEPGGNMYSHGIATMAICETYALTGDPQIGKLAQQAINYICYAQHPEGGGWRYEPQQRGDTSVVGWQIGALKSGYLSRLRVPPLVIDKASYFLDTVTINAGREYVYTVDLEEGATPHPSQATTAIGLLCRMYLGVQRDDPGLTTGINHLLEMGPSIAGNAYYNYYATQAMFHHTDGKGPMWKRWNETMRKHLVREQIQEGHATGSWDPPQSDEYHSSPGGRLYQTALNTMILEVYYRMMPLYRTDAVNRKFNGEK